MSAPDVGAAQECVPPLDNVHFAVELDVTVPLKEKNRITSAITAHGGKVVFLVNKKVNYLLTTRSYVGVDADGRATTSRYYSSKVAGAIKHGVPVVDVAFLDACLEAKSLVPHAPFLLLPNGQSTVSKEPSDKGEDDNVVGDDFEVLPAASEQVLLDEPTFRFSVPSLSSSFLLDDFHLIEDSSGRDADELQSNPQHPSPLGSLGSRKLVKPRRKSPSRTNAPPVFNFDVPLLPAIPSSVTFGEAKLPSTKEQPAESLVPQQKPEDATVPPTVPKKVKEHWRPHWGLVKIYKIDDPRAPYFPKDYEIVRQDILNVTELNENRNKFYSMELHSSEENGKSYFRIYTHYGRTDLIGDSAGDTSVHTDQSEDLFVERKECRYLHSLQQANWIYDLILQDKSDAEAKGYKSVKLAAAKVGSEKGQSITKQEGDLQVSRDEDDVRPLMEAAQDVDSAVRELVMDVYDEATNHLTSKISAKITSRGLETPLGILDVEQINEGEAILKRIQETMAASSFDEQLIAKLSGEAEMAAAKIDTPEKLEEKQELLQLMKDMLKVMRQMSDGSTGIERFRDTSKDLEALLKYRALSCSIKHVPCGSPEFKGIKKMIREDPNSKDLRILNVFKVRRDKEHEAFTQSVFNTRYLFHGSRMGNWLGILSRGILPPKRVTSLGVKRTDEGLLGSGIYFGETAATSSKYTSTGHKGYRMMLIATVALGNVKNYLDPTPELTRPPINFHSCHGVKSTPFAPTGFVDSEYVVYEVNQQRIDYLIQFQLPSDPTPLPSRSDTVATSLSVPSFQPELPKSRTWFPPGPMAASASSSSTYSRPQPARLTVFSAPKPLASVAPKPSPPVTPKKPLPEGITALAELHPYLSTWKIEVMVTYKPKSLFKWKKNEIEGRHYCCDLMDERGDSIHAVAYNEVADHTYPQLKEDQIYLISGGQFKVANKKYSKLNHDYDLTFTASTQIIPVTDARRKAAFPVIQPKFAPLSSLQSLAPDSITDVIGIVKEVSSLSEIKARTTGNMIPKRSVFIEDQGSRAEVTLWYDDAKQADSMFKVGDVLAITSAWVNRFRDQTTISTKHASYKLHVNPTKFSATAPLQQWYQNQQRAKQLAASRSAPTVRPAPPAVPRPQYFAMAVPPRTKPAISPPAVARPQFFTTMAVPPPTKSAISPLGTIQSTQLTVPSTKPSATASRLASSEKEKFAQEMARAFQRHQRKDATSAYLRHILNLNLPPDLVQLILSHVPYKRLLELQRACPDIASPYIDSTVLNLSIYRDHLAAKQADKNTLLSVYDHLELLQRRKLTKREEIDIYYCPILTAHAAASSIGSLAVAPSLDAFRKRLDNFTSGQLRFIQWTNLFLAGGSVLACLLPDVDVDASLWDRGDIDLWIVGLDKHRALAKMKAVYEQILRANEGQQVCVVRTKNAISICSGFPHRTVQIILRIFRSPAHVLSAFDLDCVAVGWDGRQVLAMPRALRALSTKTNLMEFAQFKDISVSSENRAIKYWHRGFSLRVFDAQQVLVPVSDALNQVSAVHTDGTALAKLLSLRFAQDQAANSSAAQVEKEVSPSREGSEQNGSEGAAYDEAYIPYGPSWDAAKIHTFLKKKQVRERRKLLETGALSRSRDYAPFFVFGFRLDDVLQPSPTNAHLPFAFIEQK